MLDYGRRPIDLTDAPPPDPGPAGRGRLTRGDLAAAAGRFKGAILALALLGAAAGLLLTKGLAPRYVATAQIYLDPRSLPGAGKEDVEVRQDSTGFINYIESQARILGSEIVLDRVVEAEKLAADPEFTGSGGLLASWLPAADLRGTEAEQQAAAVRSLGQRIAIRRPERTFIIEISASSAFPDKAARIANAVAQAYTDVQGTLQSESAKEAADAFSRRLDGLRDVLAAAEQRVQDYKAANGFVGAKDDVDEQSLTELNGQLTLADARLEEARSRFEQVPASRGPGADIATLAATLNIPTLTNLRNAQTEALQKVADMSMDFGPRHPAVLNARARAAEIQRLVGAELDRIAQSFRKDFERARAADAGLRRKVDALRRHSLDSAQASIRLRELDREVDADRSVYESFLARSRQTAESQQLDAANTHVITAASAPRYRSFPPSASLMMMAGTVLGAALGLAFALWRGDAVRTRPRGGGAFRTAFPNRPGAAPRRAG